MRLSSRCWICVGVIWMTLHFIWAQTDLPDTVTPESDVPDTVTPDSDVCRPCKSCDPPENSDDCDMSTCVRCQPGCCGKQCQYSDCHDDCPDTCAKGCRNTTGNCHSCFPPYTGSKCEARCPDNCKDGICEQYPNFVNANDMIDCWAGCEAGFSGLECNISCTDPRCEWCEWLDEAICVVCKNNTWGDGCGANSCHNCQEGCYKANGTCIGDCLLGYWGGECSTECSIRCAGDGACHQEHGACSAGCLSHWWSAHCDNYCTWCKDGCHRDNGTCIGQCMDGKSGDSCDVNCPLNCLDNVCDKTNSRCLRGCVEDLTWGEYCDEGCPETCLDDTCDMTGVCHRCMDGYWGQQCQYMCELCEVVPIWIGPLVAVMFIAGLVLGALGTIQHGKMRGKEKPKVADNSDICEKSGDVDGDATQYSHDG